MNKNVGIIVFIILIISVIGIFSFSILGHTIFVLKPNILLHFNSNNETLNESFIFYNLELVDDEIFGKVYGFDGTGYIRTNNSLAIDNTKGYSVSAIAYVDDDENRNSIGIVSSSVQNESEGFRIKYRNFEENDRFYVDIGTTKNEEYFLMEKGICYRKWCHYAFTYNPNGNVKIYLNGKKVKEFQSERNLILHNKINIGKTIDINNELFKGKILDVKIYEGVLSDRQVKEISENIL